MTILSRMVIWVAPEWKLPALLEVGNRVITYDQTHQRTGGASELERGCQRFGYGEPGVRPTWHQDFRKDVARIDVPTLVIHGDPDRIVPIHAAGEKTARLVKGARLATIKDGPHAVNWTHAVEVNAELVSFLRKGAAKGAAAAR